MFLPHEIYNYTSENTWTSSFDINVFIKSLYEVFNTGLEKHYITVVSHTCTAAFTFSPFFLPISHKNERIMLQIKFQSFQNLTDLHVENHPVAVCC